MQKNIGVTISAVLMILGSVLSVLFAALSAVGIFVQPPAAGASPYIKAALAVMCFLLLALTAWQFATAVGLFRRRRWSRWSILIFSGLLAFGCGSAALFAAFIPIPQASNTTPELEAGIKIGIIGFYGLLGLLGAFWIWYFNSSSVKAGFEGGLVLPAPRGRPLSISIIAWLAIFGGAFSLVMAVVPFPAVFFVWVFKGLPAHAIYAVYAGVYLWMGYGLLKLKPASRILAICAFAFSAVSIALFSLSPGMAGRNRAMMETMPAALNLAHDTYSSPSTYAGLIMAVLSSGVQIWYLARNRAAFYRDRQPRVSEGTSVSFL